MATQTTDPQDHQEHCVECGSETVHDIQIEIRTESETSDAAGYSREPYRVSTCSKCGAETAIRMNNA